MANIGSMTAANTFSRRGIVEGFFGPLWSMAHRAEVFEFGAPRGMNTYVYAPKDDPYHRARWTEPYPPDQWRALLRIIRVAQRHKIDFAYGFHPGKGLCFSAEAPVRKLLAKAARFYDAGITTFAVLFDDIPSRLEHERDRISFSHSLARAQATWMQKLLDRQPATWKGLEWWICPSYYTEDPLLARMFGAFEENFLTTFAAHLPPEVACFWTGPEVVSRHIGYGHARRIAKILAHRLILWDNYPVNDLSMSNELHLGPLRNRDARLPGAVYGYLNNPLLQEKLGLIPLATCFDYARAPSRYDPEASWEKSVVERFGRSALPHWQSIRRYFETLQRCKAQKVRAPFAPADRERLRAALHYIRQHRGEKWARELRPWRQSLVEVAGRDRP